MASFIDYMNTGSRIFFTGIKRRISKKRYAGKATEICHQIIKDCWNGRYYQTSTGNFPQFWTRDFGFCAKSLIELKQQKKVHLTLRYALNRFKEYGKVTVFITPRGKPVDFPKPAVDSLPYFIHAMKVSKFPYYAHKKFLNYAIFQFYNKFISEHTGLVKSDLHVSSMKDFAIRKSSCYDNCMVALLAKDLRGMKNLINPFEKYNYPELIKRHFWNGNYFYDDLSKKHYVAGDANLYPFIFGIIKDQTMLKTALHQIQAAKLDDPFPLKYTATRRGIKFIWEEHFLKNYESNAIWMHMGPFYVKLLREVDSLKAHDFQKIYEKLIEDQGNFFEVYDSKGKPYSSPFYYCDSGMLWAANFLTMQNILPK